MLMARRRGRWPTWPMTDDEGYLFCHTAINTKNPVARGVMSEMRCETRCVTVPTTVDRYLVSVRRPDDRVCVCVCVRLREGALYTCTLALFIPQLPAQSHTCAGWTTRSEAHPQCKMRRAALLRTTSCAEPLHGRHGKALAHGTTSARRSSSTRKREALETFPPSRS